MLLLKIAVRNVFRQKRRTVLTVLTMFGGFTLSAISIAWSDGSYNNIINMFTRNQLGHIQIHRAGYLDRPSLYKTVDSFELIGPAIEQTQGVEAWAPRLYAAGLVSVDEKSAGARVMGIDPHREALTTRFDSKVTKGRSFSTEPSHEVILGEGLARVLNADLGDDVVVVSQAADGSIANDVYTLIGIASSGDNLADRSAFYLHLRDAQELFVLTDRVHEIAVVVQNLSIVPSVAAQLRSKLADPELLVATWKEFSASFYQAMKADQQGAWIMLAIIVLVVAVGVLNTVLMTVLERRREYGVLRAVGTGSGQIFGLILTEVFVMAIISCILAAGVSYLVNYALSIHGLQMPTTLTYGGVEFNTAYTEINARSFFIPGICVVVSALFVAVFPALKAAHVAPAQAMRMH